MNRKIKCGYVAIIGRPNVGKSTLLNYMLDEKVSITSRKPQTTRHKILGIKTIDDVQTIYVDTPGLHQGVDKAMNRYMNKAAVSTLHDVDVVVFMVDRDYWRPDDEWILQKLKRLKCPVLLVINKVDRLKAKSRLLPSLEKLANLMPFSDVIPLSAKSGENVDQLEKNITTLLPEGDFLFSKDQLTDRSDRFMVAEIIREKLTRLLGEELPYALTVEMEKYKMEKGILHLAAIIWVERAGQKAIVIGKDGEQLKQIGMKARKDIEKLFSVKVFLKLWVKVKRGWSDDERALNSLGYH